MGFQVEELDEMAQESVDLSELPEEIEATVQDVRRGTDDRGKDAIYIELESEEHGEFTQKYTSMHLNELVPALEELGVDDTDDLLNNTYVWEQVDFDMGNPRFVPTDEA